MFIIFLITLQLPHTVNIGVSEYKTILMLQIYMLFSATPPHKPAELISGVFYQAQYLGSTFMFVHNSCEGVVWAQHAHNVIALIKVNGVCYSIEQVLYIFHLHTVL